MAATMKDIARRTGLGLATISKYLNGGNVREKNRIAIEEAIQELDFTVNEFARSLKTSKSKTVGVLIPELNNTFITSIITVLEDRLRQRGYGILVCDSRTDPERQSEAAAFLLNKRVDGLIVMPTGSSGAFLSPALERGVPVVLVDRTLPELDSRAGSVTVNNREIAAASTRRLLACGHREIGIIAGPKEVSTARARLAGYQDAMREGGCPAPGRLTEHGDYTIEGGYAAMERLLLHNPELTAVFIANYEMTVGAMLAINERGIAIPDALSLIGFDNLELARVVRPPLTIVEQPLSQMGKTAAALLLEQLDGAPPRSVVLEARLCPGQSVRELGAGPCQRGNTDAVSIGN